MARSSRPAAALVPWSPFTQAVGYTAPLGETGPQRQQFHGLLQHRCPADGIGWRPLGSQSPFRWGNSCAVGLAVTAALRSASAWRRTGESVQFRGQVILGAKRHRQPRRHLRQQRPARQCSHSTATPTPTVATTAVSTIQTPGHAGNYRHATVTTTTVTTQAPVQPTITVARL